jgi:hypothetical protein
LVLTGLMTACAGASVTTPATRSAPTVTAGVATTAPAVSAATATPATAPVATAMVTTGVASPPAAPAATSQPSPATAAAITPAAKAAPELTSMQWFNSAPLTLADLRGKAVLLVFWSTI